MHWRDDRLGSAERGENPTVLARMRTGWAVIGDTQHLPGYSLLLYARTADHLADLSRPERSAFLADMALLGEAVQAAVSAYDPALRRLNYEILGNSWHHLHAHVHPRYDWEPEEYRTGPVWRYGAARTAPEHALGPAHDPLRDRIAERLAAAMADAYGADEGTPRERRRSQGVAGEGQVPPVMAAWLSSDPRDERPAGRAPGEWRVPVDHPCDSRHAPGRDPLDLAGIRAMGERSRACRTHRGGQRRVDRRHGG